MDKKYTNVTVETFRTPDGIYGTATSRWNEEGDELVGNTTIERNDGTLISSEDWRRPKPSRAETSARFEALRRQLRGAKGDN